MTRNDKIDTILMTKVAEKPYPTHTYTPSTHAIRHVNLCHIQLYAINPEIAKTYISTQGKFYNMNSLRVFSIVFFLLV